MAQYGYGNAFPAGPFWDFVSNLDGTMNGGGEHASGRSRPRQHQHRRGHPCHPNGAGVNPFVQNLFSQFAPPAADDASPSSDSTRPFTPPLDLFSTPQAYILHVSLPGAKRPDVGLNYNADTTELSVSGVIHRPGDEEFQKTLVSGLGERKSEVGLFERKVKLGEIGNRAGNAPATESDASAGQQQEGGEVEIDSDGITAKLEDGVLVVTVPKVEKFVEIKKVDIE